MRVAHKIYNFHIWGETVVQTQNDLFKKAKIPYLQLAETMPSVT